MGAQTLESTIEEKSHAMFELAKKLATGRYDSVWKQLDDAEQIGKLAKELKQLRHAQNIVQEHQAQILHSEELKG